MDEIVAYADSRDVDLIVVGYRGHGTISAALLGSVSRGILQESMRPVLVLRGGASSPMQATCVGAPESGWASESAPRALQCGPRRQ